MSLFFTHEEILNTATAQLQELVIWRTPPGQGELILNVIDFQGVSHPLTWFIEHEKPRD